MVYHASLWHQFVNMVRNLKARRSPWGSHVALWPTSHQSGKTRAFSVFETSHLQGLSRQRQKAGSNPPPAPANLCHWKYTDWVGVSLRKQSIYSEDKYVYWTINGDHNLLDITIVYIITTCRAALPIETPEMATPVLVKGRGHLIWF